MKPESSRGELLEVAAGDLKTIQLSEDGMLLVRAKADGDLLAWGRRGSEAFEQKPRLNPLAVIEFTYSFVEFYGRVLRHCQPDVVGLASSKFQFERFHWRGTTSYFNPYGLETGRTHVRQAPLSSS